MLTLLQFSQNRYRFIYLTVVLLVCVAASYFWLGPHTTNSEAEYKFMHCKTCKHELPYDGKTPDLKCLQCKKATTWVPTVASVKTGAGRDPWKGFSVAVSFEILVYMGLVVLVSRPHDAKELVKYLYCNCPGCKWRLRFKETSAGKTGGCPRCKRAFTFPQFEIADTREFPAFNEVES